MTKTGVITRGTTIGQGKSANPGQVVTLPVDTYAKLEATGDIRKLTEADKQNTPKRIK